MNIPSGADLGWLDLSLFIEVTQRCGEIQLLDPSGYCRHRHGCVVSQLTSRHSLLWTSLKKKQVVTTDTKQNMNAFDKPKTMA